MSIWGRRDSEPPAEENQGQAAANDAQHQAEEPAPAFWRAQGETPESLGRDPADAPPPSYRHVPTDGPPPPAEAPPGEVPPAGAPPAGAPSAGAPSAGVPPAGIPPAEVPPAGVPLAEAPAQAAAPAGVVIDDETAVKDPALTGTPGAQPGTHHAAGPVVTEVQEPTVAVAREPSVAQAQESAPAAATITPQRWSEILVAFVDDPRGSVKMAEDTVDEAIGEFVNSVRARQRELASSWQGTETETEQLRTVLRDYRKFWHQLRQLDLGEKTGA